MDLSSSFGPLGWRKIISNQSGSVIITKDGQLIAPSVENTSDDAFSSQLQKSLLATAELSGDGVITSSTLVLYVIKCIEVRLSASFGVRNRIRLLRVVEALLWVVNQHEAIIQTTLTKTNIWAELNDIRLRVIGLVRSVVVPSSNNAVAADVEDIVVSWLRLNHGLTPSNDDIIVLCRRLLANFDTLVHSAIGQFICSPRCYHFTSERDVIIKGRCRDYSALTNNLYEQDNIEFVCIMHVLPAAHSTVEHTVQLSTAHHALNLHSAGHANIALLVKLLSATESARESKCIRVVLCCDAVNDEAMQVLAQNGLYLIDCIPPAYLSYLAKRTGCVLHLSPADLLLSSQQSGTGVVWGRFHHLERIVYGTRQEIHYKLCGIELVAASVEHTVETDGHKVDTAELCAAPPLQLVLRGTSTLHVGIHVRMLQRSLKAIAFSLLNRTPSAADKVKHPLDITIHKHPSIQNLPSNTPNTPQKKPATASSATTVVPGAGAGELGWSLLWRQMALTLAKGPSDEFSGKFEEGNTTSCLSFENKIKPLVDLFSAALYQRMGATYPEGRRECAFLCALLSDAYRQVPLQCVINAIDVLPENCENAGNNDAGDASNGLPRCVNKRNAKAALLHWESCFCRAGAATGRVGLVVDPDPLAEEICSFQDALLHPGVYSSYNHFWSGFLGVLSALQLRLRVGEVIPVKKRQLFVSRPQSEHEADEGDEDVDATIQSFW